MRRRISQGGDTPVRFFAVAQNDMDDAAGARANEQDRSASSQYFCWLPAASCQLNLVLEATNILR
jgi:hypothetical protein